MNKKNNQIKKSFICSCIALALIASFSGCFETNGTINDTISGKEIDHIGYTIDEIKAMALETNNSLDNISDDDITEEALHAYNQMLGYVENVVGVEYKVYDFYHVNFDSVKGYVIKIVIAEDVDYVEAQSPDSAYNYKEEIIMLSCDEDGTNVSSGLVPHLMAHQWTNDIVSEIETEFPEYHVNPWYVGLYAIVPDVKYEKHEDFYDYYYYYDIDTYNGSGYFEYDNCINIIVPTDTPESSSEAIYEDIKPILEKYCVTDVDIIAPKSEDVLNRIIEEEKITGNNYDYDDEMEWISSYNVRSNF